MAVNIIDTVKSYFTTEFTNQISNSLDESSSSITKALSAVIPIGLAGILKKGTSGNEGAESVSRMAKESAGYFPQLPHLDDLHNEEKGSDFVTKIFGNNLSQVNKTIADYAGIKNISSSAITLFTMPVIMGYLGKHAEQNNLSANGLSGFLSSQKDNISEAMPAGLSSLAGLLGIHKTTPIGEAISARTKTATADHTTTAMVGEHPRKRKPWVLNLLIIILVIALLWYLSRSCNQNQSTTGVTADTSTTAPAMAPPSKNAVESIKVKLPNGKELNANKGGIEDQLVTFLNSDWKSLSEDSLKNRWFDFDNLNFNTSTATLLPQSEKQLDNIAEILKAFPDAKIKIGGYTDASGDLAFNKKLSQERADAAKDGLTARGVGAQVVGAEGYGSVFAKLPSTAPDSERAMDRHVSVSVRK